MKGKLNGFVAILVVFCLIGNVSGQQWVYYNQYTSGLAGNVVYDIKTDKDGNKWFACFGGASSFDGSTWRRYRTANGLASDIVYCIAVDNYNNKWFGTSQGVSKFDGISFTNYYTSDGLVGDRVKSIAIDASGNLWFGTDQGISKFNGTSFTNYTQADGLIHNDIQTISIDISGSIWFGTYMGISVYNGTSWMNYTHENTSGGLAGNDIRDIFMGSGGVKWIATYSGISVFSGTTWTKYQSTLISPEVNCITRDKQGKIWCGTQGGISIFDGSEWTVMTTADGLQSDLIYAIFPDAEQKIWTGGEFNGVSRYALPFLSLSANELVAQAWEGSNVFFSISTNADWSVTSDQSWLVCLKTSGSGDAYVRAIAGENPGTQARTAILTVAAFGLPEQEIVVTQNASEPSLTLGTDRIVLASEQNSYAYLDIEGNVSWTAVSDQPWLSPGVSSGSGSTQLPVTAQQNTDPSERTALVTVTGSGIAPQTVTVTQIGANPALLLSASTIQVGPSPGNVPFDILCTVAWTADDDAGWIELEKTGGSGNATNWLTVQENPSTASRNATVTVTATGVPAKTVTITQTGQPYVTLPADTIFIDAANNPAGFSSVDLAIESNTHWEVSWSDLWFIPGFSQGTGNTVMPVVAEPNFSDAPRTGQIYIKPDGSLQQTVIIKQERGPYLNLSTDNITLDAVNGADSFSIESNRAWIVYSGYNFATIPVTSGTGNAVITLSAPDNKGFDPLHGYLMVQYADEFKGFGGNTCKMVEIVQAPSIPYLDVSTDKLSLGSDQDTAITFYISSNVEWWVSTDKSYLSTDISNGTGNATITLYSQKNPCNMVMEGTVTIANAESIPFQYIDVSQAAKNQYLAVSKDTLQFVPDGAFSTGFAISSNTEWIVDLNGNYGLSINKQMGSGDDTIRITAPPNYDLNSIRSSILVNTNTCIPSVKTISFTQDSMALQTSTEMIELSASGIDTFHLDIFSNTGWSAYSDGFWISLGPAAGRGNSTMEVTASPNCIFTENTGKIFVTAGTLTREVSVVQHAPYLNLSKDTLYLEATDGSTATFDILSNAGWSSDYSYSGLFSMDKPGGSGNATVRLTVTGTGGAPGTSSMITISDCSNSFTRLLTVMFLEPGTRILSVSTPSLTIGCYENSRAEFSVLSNVTWTVISDQPWLTATPAAGENNQTVSLQASVNPANLQRSAILTISADGLPAVTVTVTQSAFISGAVLSSSTINAAGSGAIFVVIEANAPWTLDTDQDWLSVEPASGDGSDTAVITVSHNPNEGSRTAWVTFTVAGSDPQTLSITQDGTITGAGDHFNEMLTVYPNPVLNNLFITGAKSEMTIRFHDLKGNLVAEKKLPVFSRSMDVSELLPGYYILRWNSHHNTIVILKK